jgi:hypothetical protein
VNSTGDEVDDTITRSELKEALDSAIVSSIIMLLHFRLYRHPVMGKSRRRTDIEIKRLVRL